MMLASLYRLFQGLVGSIILKETASLSSNEIGLFCVYGLGDTYFVCLLMPALKKRFPHCRFVLIIPQYHQGLGVLFQHYFDRVVIFNHRYSKSFFPFLGTLAPQHIYYAHPSVCFWGKSLNILGCKGLTIFDLYRFIFKLQSNAPFGTLHISSKIKKSAEKRCKSLNLPQGKTVILVMESGVTTPVSQNIWTPLGIWLEKQGYTPVIMSKHSENYPFPTIFFPLHEAIPFIEFCGYFIATRSGLCDVVSSARANMFFLYPEDFNHHSSTFNIYNFKSMGIPTAAKELILDSSNNLHPLKKLLSKVMG